jgi:nickel-type superoxide dismutase maturation protease
MIPALKPGRIVIAHRTTKYTPGRIFIIRHNGLEKIKRLQSVTDGKLFVVGDNLAASTDSRSFGPIPTSSVIGVVMWPRPAQKR